jgi:hypothetical protein
MLANAAIRLAGLAAQELHTTKLFFGFQSSPLWKGLPINDKPEAGRTQDSRKSIETPQNYRWATQTFNVGTDAVSTSVCEFFALVVSILPSDNSALDAPPALSHSFGCVWQVLRSNYESGLLLKSTQPWKGSVLCERD